MKLRSILFNAVGLCLMLALFVSCDDNSTSTDPDAPGITAPDTQNMIVGESVELTFSVSVPDGYASSNVTATNGDATVSSEPSEGATSGDVVVTYTASASGAGSVELTITDESGNSNKATAVLSVTEEENTIRVAENITEDTTWEAGKTYILGGRIAVESGATLTIEAGTVVKGEAGTGSNASALLVARGAMLNANGTADAPIIFTSVADEITPEMVANGNFASPNLDPDIQGLWGGVIVLGNAPISGSADELQIEGIPTSDANGLYGGDDPADNSGSITYISIRHGGANIGEGNEINGLTLGGVGSGTIVENVEVVGNQDDGVEWFGGTVTVSDVLVWNSGDDAIDTDQAWAGTLDNFVIVSPGGSSFELDGPEGTYQGSGHTVTNGTAYIGGNGSETIIDVDANSDVTLSNIFFLGMTINPDDTPGQTMSSDYADFAANSDGYGIATLEAIIPDTYADADGNEQTSSLTVSDFFTGGADAEVTVVNRVSEATVGADASVFSWTWASQSGALTDVGIE